MKENSFEIKHKNFLEKAKLFKKKYGTDEACRSHLRDFKKWPDEFICPNPECGHKEKYEHNKPNHRRIYTCKKCKRQYSEKWGTIFHKTQIGLNKWFFMIFLVVRKKPFFKTTEIQKYLRIKHYKTAQHMRKRIQDAVYAPDAYNQLAGLISKKKLERVKKSLLEKKLIKQLNK